MYEISPEVVDIMRHIFDARIDNSTDEAYQVWCTARDIFEYALAGNLEVLVRFDYMQTAEEYNYYYGNQKRRNKMRYLVMSCVECGDYEVGYDRTPLLICNEIPLKYMGHGYEHYQINYDGTLTLMKKTETCKEEGMALYRWSKDDDPEEVEPQVIYKYKNKTRYAKIPAAVKNAMSKLDDVENLVKSCGYMNGYDDEYYWVYGEYMDDDYSLGY